MLELRPRTRGAGAIPRGQGLSIHSISYSSLESSNMRPGLSISHFSFEATFQAEGTEDVKGSEVRMSWISSRKREAEGSTLYNGRGCRLRPGEHMSWRRERGFHFPGCPGDLGCLSCLVNKMDSPVFHPPHIMKTVRSGPSGCACSVPRRC